MNKSKKAKFKPTVALPLKKVQLPLPFVQLNITTWLKDSHGLFDYQATQNKCEKQILNIVASSKIYRNSTTMRTQVIELADNRVISPENIYIGSVIVDRTNQTYKVQSPTVTSQQSNEVLKNQNSDILQNSFLVIKGLQKEQNIQGYPLIPGNVIRLGRVQYVVLEIRNGTNTEVYKQTSHFELNTGNYVVQEPLTGCCKICLCEQSTEEDPLISPCLCKGTCQFIHVGCLKNWINSKVKKELNDIVLSYNFSKFECQICKAPFPKTITMCQKNILQMITIEKPEKPYLILESVNNKEDNKRQRNLHVVFANQDQTLKVGRGHQCQMRVNDISVSRAHAEICYKNNKFYVKDLKSKFGTLIKFRQQLNIKNGVRLQFGRVCYQFTVKQQQPKLNQEVDTNEEDENIYI